VVGVLPLQAETAILLLPARLQNGNKYAAANGNVYKNIGSGWSQTHGTASRGYGAQEHAGSSAFGGGEVVGKPGRLVLVALQAAAAASGVDGNRTTRFAVRSPLPCGLRKVDSEVLEDGMLLNHLRVVIANGLLPLALLPLAACNNTKQPEKPSIKVLPRLMRRGTRPIVGKVWR
jgi:hypothetical protein